MLGGRKGICCLVILMLTLIMVSSVSGISIYNQLEREITGRVTNGKTLYVGGSGQNNYTKIQDAIENASIEDTIFVFSGIYHENIVIDKSINLIGQDKDSTVIDANYNRNVVDISTDKVNISGFTIQNSGNDSYWDSGINIESDYNNISDNNILNNMIGIRLNYKAQKNTISYNDFINDGLWVRNSYQNVVFSNTVNDKPLVYLENEADKVIYDAGQIVLINCNNITVQNLELYNATIGIQLWETNYCIISNNTIYENYNSGILLYQSCSNIITGNSIYSNGEGIGLNDWCNRNSITNNIISLNRDDGISIYYSSANTISGNIIQENGHSCYYWEYGSGIALDHIADRNIIRENIILNNLYGVLLFGARYNIISKNLITNNTEAGMFVLAFLNFVNKNNFINNKCAATFESYLFFYNRWTRWRGNYWDDWKGFGRYEIDGVIVIPKYYRNYVEWIEIPWDNFDWFPANEPYDIEV